MSNSKSTTSRATRLRANNEISPLGIGDTQPTLSWWVDDDRRGAAQSAFQIRAASDASSLEKTDLWDSGKIVSDRSIGTPYAGKALASRQKCVWQVKLWDAAGKEGPWSDVASFEIGLLTEKDWSAEWTGSPVMGAGQIGGVCPYLRRGFELASPVKSARLYVTALGIYEAHLNGQKISRDLFRPGWTDYRKRLVYDVYDVTSMLQPGKNTIGALLGDGWYCGRIAHLDRQIMYGQRPALLAQLEITTADGKTHTINSDSTWQWRPSPTLYSDMLNGEAYDARQEVPGWCDANPPASDGWQPVIAVPKPATKLVARTAPSVRVTEELKPIADPMQSNKGQWGRMSWMFDLGQNFAGVIRLNVQGPAGATVQIKYAEMLDTRLPPAKAPMLYTENLRTAIVTDHYTLRGDPAGETWTPRFTYHGFRYVEVSVAERYAKGPAAMKVSRETVTGLVMHNDMPRTGDFKCNHELINKLFQNTVWGQRGNFFEVPTDCPQRDERLGWLGDAQVFAPIASFNYDAHGFFRKWCVDLQDAQIAKPGDFHDGAMPCVAPDIDIIPDSGPGWADAAVVVPWSVYLATGDQKILADQYASMTKWLEQQWRTSRDGLRCWANSGHHEGFGDWLAPDSAPGTITGGTSKPLIATAYFIYASGILIDIAKLLGHEKDIERFTGWRETAIKTFQREFLAAEGALNKPSQTGCLMALGFGVLPNGKEQPVVDQLVELFKKADWHLQTGFLGTPLICPVLTQFGHADIAHRVLMQTTYPGWLFPVTNGATTMWERWDSWTPDKGFGDTGMNSFNHYAYGAVCRWMVDSIAGLAIAPAKPGYKHFIVAPTPSEKIRQASASLDSPSGRIEISWKLTGEEITGELLVPPNATAEVKLPGAPAKTVTAGRHQLQGIWKPTSTTAG